MTGCPPCSSIERDLYALPVRLGGLGLMNPCSAASSAFHDSEKLTAPLVALIAAQCMTQTVDRDHVRHLKQSIRKNNRDHQTLLADTLHSQLSPSLKCCTDLAREPGSSSWLTVLPIQEHGFHLHKGDFRDAFFFCYGITPLNTSKTCQCGTSFSVDHAMVYPFGGFPTIRHNEVRDLTASLLTEVSHNVQTEPSLQPVTTETFSLVSANTTNDARLDIKTTEASGVGARTHILMLGCFTQMLPATAPLALNLPINVMRMQRRMNMVTTLEILNMEFSSHWFLPPLVAWDVRPLCSTDV